MGIRKVLVALIVKLSVVSLAGAVPTVSNISGTAGHGQTITIGGSSFGTKATAAPLIFDTVESGSFSSSWGSSNDLSVTSSGQRHARSTRSGFQNFASGNWDGCFRANNSVYPKWFAQYWVKLDSNWDWGTSTFEGNNKFLSNIKIFRMWNPGDNPENFVVAITGWDDQIEAVVENTSANNHSWFMSGLRSRLTTGSWHLFQFQYGENSATGARNGSIKIWFDGQIVLDKSDLMTRESSGDLKRPFILGFSNVWESGGGMGERAPNDFYIDDIYLDNAWSRVEIGNASTYSACTRREIQTPLSWGASSIQVRVNAGAFNTGDTAYVYVADSDGNVNSNGLPITIGGGTTTPPTNQTPMVSAGSDRTVTLPAEAALSGSASDDGLPNPPAALTLTWTKVSGPGTVVFTAPNSAPTNATFSAAGSYVLRLTGSDGSLSASDDVAVTVNPALPVNLSPTVNAGANITITLPASASLSGTASDDGLPNPPGVLTRSWSKVSGPGTVNFSAATALATNATFSAAGTYVVRLTISDSLISISDDVTVTVNPAPPSNVAPTVNAGPDRNITFPAAASLSGTATDDGLPNPPATMTRTWTKVSGPGTVDFTAPNAAATSAAFSSVGTYVLRLTVSDSVLSASDDVTVIVNATPPANLTPTVSAGPDRNITLPASASLAGTSSDDGLPNPPGTVSRTWTKISGPGTVSFTAPTAAATNASFSAAGTYVLRLTVTDSLLSASDDVTVIVNAAPPVNQTPTASAGPDRSITLPAAASLAGSSSDDGLPNPPGATTRSWTKVSGPGTVVFSAPTALTTNATFSTAGTYVCRLTVSDSLLSASDDVTVVVAAAPVPPTNQAPTISAGTDQTVTFPAAATLRGTATDDGLPNPPARLTTTWQMISGPAAAQLASASALSTQVNFPAPGQYIFRLQVGDGALTRTDDVAIQVQPGTPSRQDPDPSQARQNVVKPSANQPAMINYEVTEPGTVEIVVLQRYGRSIRTLENGHKERGTYMVQWDGANANGSLAASGVYTVVIKANGKTTREKVVLLK